MGHSPCSLFFFFYPFPYPPPSRPVVVSLLLISCCLSNAQLSYDYHQVSCPHVEDIVRKTLLPIFITDPTSPSAFLRLFFHDCQVQGCDASILLDSDGKSITSEMLSSRNFAIRNRKSIGEVKSRLEEECPGQVSCADVIALAAREAVAFAGGPSIVVPLGRRDSTSASKDGADVYLPPPTITVDDLLDIFFAKGFTTEESVAILGAHTLGVGHCANIVDRLYDPKRDEKMEYGFELLLRFKCPNETPPSNKTFVTNDLTALLFDNQYYRDVMRGRGLFSIDSSISMDTRTSPIVRMYAEDQMYFFQAFSSAFVKLSAAGVLTGEEGEVRRECSQLN